MKTRFNEWEKDCKYCGTFFISTNRAELYCCEDCRQAAEYISDSIGRKIYADRAYAKKAMAGITKSKVGKIEREARKKGLHYQDIQMAKTLELVGGVKI